VARSLGTINSPLTTLGEPELAQALARMRDDGVEVVAMEVSSHGLDQHRVDGVHFEVTAFTNLTQDHLDYHSDMACYFAAKKRLFLALDSTVSVINVACDAGIQLADEIARARPQRHLIRVGSADADVFARAIEPGATSTSFELVIGGQSEPVALPLVGAHNIENALVAAGCAHALGVDGAVIAAALARAPQIPGRLQRIGADAPFSVFIDYAHTPDALEHALTALRTVTDGALTVVFGCGGDRDQAKRPLMGAIAARLSDRTILTCDNPRSEDPAAIIEAIRTGFEAEGSGVCQVEVDRARAIAAAIEAAHPGDSVLIAGKGHETYQIFAERTIDFDDAQVAGDALTRQGFTRE